MTYTPNPRLYPGPGDDETWPDRPDNENDPRIDDEEIHLCPECGGSFAHAMYCPLKNSKSNR